MCLQKKIFGPATGLKIRKILKGDLFKSQFLELSIDQSVISTKPKARGEIRSPQRVLRISRLPLVARNDKRRTARQLGIKKRLSRRTTNKFILALPIRYVNTYLYNLPSFSTLYERRLFILYNIAYCKTEKTVLFYRHRGDTDVHVNLKAEKLRKSKNGQFK